MLGCAQIHVPLALTRHTVRSGAADGSIPVPPLRCAVIPVLTGLRSGTLPGRDAGLDAGRLVTFAAFSRVMLRAIRAA
jgi:hypothetical protein